MLVVILPTSAADNISPASDSSSSSVFFDRGSSAATPFTEDQRWAIISLHRDGQKRQTIAQKIPCSIKTVNHWINHYDQHPTVTDKNRSGRKRKTDENTNINIVVTANVEMFTVPKRSSQT